MRTHSIKQIVMALFLLIISAGTAAAASWKLTTTRLNQPGSSDTLRVEIAENDFSFSAFQVDIQLPSGLTLEGAPLMSSITKAWVSDYNTLTDGSIRLVAYEANNKVASVPVGTLFLLPVKVGDNYKKDNVVLKNGLLSKQPDTKMEVTDQTIAVNALQPLTVKILSGLTQMESSHTPATLTYETVPAGIQLKDSYFFDANCQKAASAQDRMKPGTIYVKLSYAGDDTYAPFSKVYEMTITAKPALKVVNISGLTQMESSKKPAEITYETEPANLPLNTSYFTDAECTKLATDADRMKPGLIYVVLSYAGNDSIAAFKDVYKMTITAKPALKVVNISGLTQMENSKKPAEISYEIDPADLQLTVSYFTDAECTTQASDADRMKPGTIYVKLNYAGDEQYASFSKVYTMTITAKPALKVVNISGLTQMESSKKPAEITYKTDPTNLQLTVSYFTDAECTTQASDADRMKPGTIYVLLSYAGNDSIAAFKDVYKMTITAKSALKVEVTSSLTQMESKEPVVLAYKVTPTSLQDQLTLAYYLDNNCTNAASEADRTKAGNIYAKLTFAGNDSIAAFEQVYQIELVARGALVVNVSGLEHVESSQMPATINYTTEPEGIKLDVAYFKNTDCTESATEDDRKTAGTIYARLTFAGNDSIAAFEKVYPVNIKAILQVVNISGLTQMESSKATASVTYETQPVGIKLEESYFTDEKCTTPATEADRKKPGTIYVKLSYTGDDKYAPFSAVYTMKITAKPALEIANISGLTQKESSDKLASITYETNPVGIPLEVCYYKDANCSTIATELDRQTAGTIYAKLTYAGNDTIAAFEKVYPMTITPRTALVVSVSNLEQVYNSSKPAEISYTTVPTGIQLTEEYFIINANGDTISAEYSDRTQQGTIYVKLTYKGDDTYGCFEQVYTLVLTDKKNLSAEENVVFNMPKATPIVKGQPLGNSQLVNGSVKVGDLNMPGTFMWTEPTLKPEAGEAKYGVTFVPNNANYAAKDTLIELTVKDIFRIAVESGENGSAMIIGQTKDSLYVKGEQITLKAVPDANYQFEGWTLRTSNETTAGNQAEMGVKVNTAGTYVATFSPIKHAVTKTVDGNGTLTVTAIEASQKVNVNSGDLIQQGTTLNVIAKAADGYQLSALTLNDQVLAGDKFTLIDEARLKAVFTEKPAKRRTLTINEVANGSLMVYNKQGSPVASGSTLAEGEEITLVALPAAGYQMQSDSLKINGTSLDGTTYIVGDVDLTASVKFEAKKYKVSAKSVKTDGTPETSATITLNVTGEQAYGTPVKIDNVSGGKLIAILANGKDYGTDLEKISFTVTGNLEITAMFDMRVDIEPRYIMWPYQEYYYNGTSRNFIPFASQTYAGFDFKVMYQLDDAAEIESAINAGKYKVHLSREQDALYNKFEKTIENGLVIKQSKVTVIEAPDTTKKTDPKTRPANTTITKEVDGNFFKYTIEPKEEKDKQNYEGIVYYVERAGAKKAKFSVGSRLRGTENGGVRVTNGGEVITAKELAVGMQVYLEAVPNEGFKFAYWADDPTITDNPRKVTISANEKENHFVPFFEGKKKIELTVENSTYTGAAQQPKLEGADKQLSFKVDAFTDPKRTQPASEIKNAGTYYLKIYRAEDATYQAYQNNELTFTINKAELTNITWPTASDIKVGDALSASTLMGGSAGIVTGTFEWANPTEQATEKSDGKNFKVKFVPNDTKNYPESVEGIVSVTILEAPVAALTLNKATMSLTKGNTETLTATGVPVGATAVWSSDNEAVATVDAGKVTAVAAGTATITVTVQTNSGTLTATCVVTVTEQPTEEPTTPDQPTEPTNPEQPVKPEQVPNPIVEQRTDSTAVITWEKVSGASSYKLFLYADKSKKELIATYTFDKDGNLKASNIAFNLQNLTAGKSYYIETVAYDSTGKALVTKGIELTADPTATEEVASPMEVYTSRSMIHIQLSQPMGIRILNMAGSFVYDRAAAEGRLDIPVASAGIYAVILSERNQLIEVKKVIVR